MTKKSRRKFSTEFKAKVVLEALRERNTIEELARKYELHPTQINTWKKEAMSKMASVFGADRSEAVSDQEQQTEKLYAQIGQLKVENDFLKKRCFYEVGNMQRSEIIQNDRPSFRYSHIFN